MRKRENLLLQKPSTRNSAWGHDESASVTSVNSLSDVSISTTSWPAPSYHAPHGLGQALCAISYQMSGDSPSSRSFTAKSTNRTHIFVSIYHDQPRSASHGGHHDSLPAQSYRWTILVEPAKHRRLSLHHGDTEPVLFLINKDNSSSWACHFRHLDPTDEENFVGKIHIGESRNATTIQVEELLRARLLPEGEEWPRERTSEYWIRAAVHALQEGGLVEKFELDDFMTFAKGYVAEREADASEDVAPAAIEYARIERPEHRSPSKKLGLGFWISYPQSAFHSPLRSREASPYGGLM
jgi:hypothetical protein